MLPALIRFYRAHLSGRGPLRRCRCTFESTESCSAYGLRVAESVGPLEALRLIRARLRRCRSAAVYRAEGVWLWGRLYDRCDPKALEAELVTARELPASRALVRDSLRIVRGEAPRTRAPLIRNGQRIGFWLRQRLARRVALVSVLALGSSFVVGAPAALLGLLLPLLWRGHAREAERFEQLRYAAAFSAGPPR